MLNDYQDSEQHKLYKILKTKDLAEAKEHFLDSVTLYEDGERANIRKALELAENLHAGQLRASQVPYIIHPIIVGSLLISMKLDSDTVIAGLLHDTLEDTTLKPEELQELFSADVLKLVDGVTKIQAIDDKNRTYKEASTIRKMLLAMCEDIRVIFIKLADKLHNMATLEFLSPEKRQKNAQECLDIYAPLAEKLGINSIHNVLEDLSFKILNPIEYQEIKSLVQSNKKDREAYLNNIRANILGEAEKLGMKIEVKTRSKHFYSIYQKLQRRSKELTEIFDMLGLRLYCETKGDCYTLLGLIHSLYKPVEGRFKDYIAVPKPNGYQSIHTTLFMPDKRFVEFQIRTYEMDYIAEQGVASHWLYKEGGGLINRQEISLVNRLRQWKDTLPEESSEFLTSIKEDMFERSIYVFTPKGEVIELPEGANAIDFAYSIHTDIGNHCYQAMQEGKIYPLTKPLKTNSVIEIITNKKSNPIPSWLTTVRTRNARSRIRSWLKKNSPHFILQEDLLLKKPKKENLLKEARESTNEMGTPTSVVKKFLKFFKRKPTLSPEERIISNEADMESTMVRMAACCKPSEGDDISGYVSRGKGIMIHKSTCKNLANLPEKNQRLIEVDWIGRQGNSLYRFDIVFAKKDNVFGIVEKLVKENQATLVSGRIDNDGRGQGIAVFHVECTRVKSQRILEILKAMAWIKSVNVRGQEWNDFL